VFGFTDNVKKSWTSVRTKAGLPDVRFHVCVTPPPSLVAAHFALPEVGRVLGHTQANTTYRYGMRTSKRRAAQLRC